MIRIFVSIRSTLSGLKMPTGQSFEDVNRSYLKRSLLLVYFFVLSSLGAMCFIEADTFAQYSTAIFSLNTELNTFNNIITLFSNISNIIELIGDFESGLQMRKFFYT